MLQKTTKRAFKLASAGVMFVAGILLFFCLPDTAPAAVSISPAYVTLNLDKGRPSGSFTISNVGEKEERYRIRVFAFNVEEIGGGLKEIDPNDPYSIAPLILFNPKEFTLPVKTKQKIRFTVVPRKLTSNREYRAAMELLSLNRAMAQSKDAEGREFKFEIIESILVPIFGVIGTVRYQGAVDEIKLVKEEKKPKLHILVRNSGEGRTQVTDGTYEIMDPSGSTVATGPLKHGNIYPKSKRWFYLDVDENLKAGKYMVKVQLNCPQLNASIEEKIQLVWPAS